MQNYKLDPFIQAFHLHGVSTVTPQINFTDDIYLWVNKQNGVSQYIQDRRWNADKPSATLDP